MAEQRTRAYCSICGQGYPVCSSCMKQNALNSWRTVTDSIGHYKIYLAIHRYTLSGDKETARKELSCCDLSGLEGFNENIQVAIKEIMADGETP